MAESSPWIACRRERIHTAARRTDKAQNGDAVGARREILRIWRAKWSAFTYWFVWRAYTAHVYHFMLALDWDEDCKAYSFWADSFNGIPIHLNHRDVTFTAVSRAPLSKINVYKKRMGWNFPWISSNGSDFSYDFQASFKPEQAIEGRVYHNYQGSRLAEIIC